MAYTGFTNLPNEVLEKIALALLDEDNHDTDEEEDNYDSDEEEEGTTSGRCNLSRFSRLDKHIYEVATEILYKKIDVSTPVARPLLQTVL